MLSFVAEELKDDWKLFFQTSNKFGYNKEILKIPEESGKETIIKFFESYGWLVKWEDLKNVLSAMEKEDVTTRIMKTFLYTKGKNN